MQLSKLTRGVIGIGSLAMISAFFLPLWQIQLWAPQYPEGLNMKIWHNRLSGAFDIINGLNHYIGMREIKAEMFPEFQYIGILIGVFIALGILTAVLGKRLWLLIFTSTAFVYGAAALYDFYRWGYDYGHNLDTHAAIQVPGMSYQPPVLGYKNLLNFTAYSGPDQGAWVIIAVSLLATGLLVYEYFFKDRKKVKSMTVGLGLIAVSALSLQACSIGPEPIRYGKDQCAHCKMTLTDKRYGAEIVTNKGKVVKFDDLNCLVSWLKEGKTAAADVAQTLAVDFSRQGQFVDVQKGLFLQHESLKSPMRADIATFSTQTDLDEVKTRLGGGMQINWEAVQKSF